VIFIPKPRLAVVRPKKGKEGVEKGGILFCPNIKATDMQMNLPGQNRVEWANSNSYSKERKKHLGSIKNQAPKETNGKKTGFYLQDTVPRAARIILKFRINRAVNVLASA
jgi:hypothetical protein